MLFATRSFLILFNNKTNKFKRIKLKILSSIAILLKHVNEFSLQVSPRQLLDDLTSPREEPKPPDIHHHTPPQSKSFTKSHHQTPSQSKPFKNHDHLRSVQFESCPATVKAAHGHNEDSNDPKEYSYSTNKDLSSLNEDLKALSKDLTSPNDNMKAPNTDLKPSPTCDSIINASETDTSALNENIHTQTPQGLTLSNSDFPSDSFKIFTPSSVEYKPHLAKNDIIPSSKTSINRDRSKSASFDGAHHKAGASNRNQHGWDPSNGTLDKTAPSSYGFKYETVPFNGPHDKIAPSITVQDKTPPSNGTTEKTAPTIGYSSRFPLKGDLQVLSTGDFTFQRGHEFSSNQFSPYEDLNTLLSRGKFTLNPNGDFTTTPNGGTRIPSRDVRAVNDNSTSSEDPFAGF